MFHGFGSGVPSSSTRRTHPGRQTCVTQKGPSQWRGACACLLEKVCTGAPNRPPAAAYCAQTTGDSSGAPGGTMHFEELLAILFCRQGRHHHAGAGPARLRRMPEHGGRPWWLLGGKQLRHHTPRRKASPPWLGLKMSDWPTVCTEAHQSTWHHASSSSHRCES
jgi:hypothetical protein